MRGRRRLARAVGADKPEELSLLDDGVDAGDRDQIAETMDQTLRFDRLLITRRPRFLALAPHDVLGARLVPAHRPPDGVGDVREQLDHQHWGRARITLVA
jgi:hypothetical protein